MVWNDNGVNRKTIVIDMQYHSSYSSAYSSCGITDKNFQIASMITNIPTNYVSLPFKNQTNNNYILGVSVNNSYGNYPKTNPLPSAYKGQSDAVLDAKFNWRDEHTSRQNTDAYISFASTLSSDSDYGAVLSADAFYRCRNITVNGVGCDLPNMQTLVRIFCDRAVLHAFDATDTNDYWSSWWIDEPEGYGGNVCSSSRGGTATWSIGWWQVKSTGNVGTSSSGFTVPVLDL